MSSGDDERGLLSRLTMGRYDCVDLYPSHRTYGVTPETYQRCSAETDLVVLLPITILGYLIGAETLYKRYTKPHGAAIGVTIASIIGLTLKVGLCKNHINNLERNRRLFYKPEGKDAENL